MLAIILSHRSNKSNKPQRRRREEKTQCIFIIERKKRQRVGQTWSIDHLYTCSVVQWKEIKRTDSLWCISTGPVSLCHRQWKAYANYWRSSGLSVQRARARLPLFELHKIHDHFKTMALKSGPDNNLSASAAFVSLLFSLTHVFCVHFILRFLTHKKTCLSCCNFAPQVTAARSLALQQKAFNTARWNLAGQAMHASNSPPYLSTSMSIYVAECISCVWRNKANENQRRVSANEQRAQKNALKNNTVSALQLPILFSQHAVQHKVQLIQRKVYIYVKVDKIGWHVVS